MSEGRAPVVSRLRAVDAEPYRALMLQAYVEAADAYTSTAEERVREPLSWWARRIAADDGGSESFGAWVGDVLVGTVALEYSAKPKTRHAALLLGMYVRPENRRGGLGEQLVRAALTAAAQRPGLRQVSLTVTAGNTAAIALYRRLGFEAWGTEPDAICTPGGFQGKVHMLCRLHPSAEAL